MLTTTIPTRSYKPFYTEMEAAESLGVSLEEFRELVRTHIAQSDEDVKSIAGATYQASDIVVLKLLAKLPSRT